MNFEILGKLKVESTLLVISGLFFLLAFGLNQSRNIDINNMKIPHKGTISGDEIKMTYEMMGQPGEILVKRVQ